MNSQADAVRKFSNMADTQKRFFIKTLGCKVNQYESQAMREILIRAGFKECLTQDIADVYILNTCTVTGRADRESRYWLGFFHKANPKAKIVVAGCYVERDSGNISFLPGISHILKNNEKARIAEVLTNSDTKYDIRSTPFDPSASSGSSRAKSRDDRLRIRPAKSRAERGERSRGTTYDSFGSLSITDFKDHTKAFVKIQDGCENGCSYCKVPLVRGVLRSRPITDILKEVSLLVEKGFKEIVLTGICLGAWGRDPFSTAIAQEMGIDDMNLVDVLRELNKAPGDFRIRLSSIEPAYVTDELIDYIAKDKRISRHLHIPLQSGDDAVLKAMNRPYTSKDYKSLIEKTRAKMKDIAITTDVLIGFPGEADSNFRNTVNFIKETLPSRTHIFTFSKRKGTAAYEMAGTVSVGVMKQRYHMLEVAALSASYLYRARFLDKTLNILVETRRDKESRLLTGYSDNYIKVLFEGPDELMKRIVPVRIKDVNLMKTLGAYEP